MPEFDQCVKPDRQVNDADGWLALLYHENSKISSSDLLDLEARIKEAADNPERLRPCPAIQPSVPRTQLPRRYWPWGIDGLIRRRRTIRHFRRGPINLHAVSRILFNASGVTQKSSGSSTSLHWPLRTAPSAGAIYPLEIRLAAMKICSLQSGIYQYQPYEHVLELVTSDVSNGELAAASLHPDLIDQAALAIGIFADWRRMAAKYGDRGYRYVLLEAGHMAHNIILTCSDMKLAAVPVGGFVDDDIHKVFASPPEARPVYLIIVARQ